MGLGSTAKKIQKVADLAEELYSKVNELKSQLQELRGTVEETNDRVDELDRELAEQRALLEAIADQQGIDVETVQTEALIDDAEAKTDADSP
jgi:methyl-accepting chemotaxis protein